MHIYKRNWWDIIIIVFCTLLSLCVIKCSENFLFKLSCTSYILIIIFRTISHILECDNARCCTIQVQKDSLYHREILSSIEWMYLHSWRFSSGFQKKICVLFCVCLLVCLFDWCLGQTSKREKWCKLLERFLEYGRSESNYEKFQII